MGKQANVRGHVPAALYLLERVEDTEDGCWQWKASTRNGYGAVYGPNDWGEVTAHRLAARVWLGFRGTGRDFICHRCDNKKCINPSHLFVGTPQENTHDMIAKGRARYDPHSKLTLDQVNEIRGRAALGERQSALAREFGVHPSAISRIANQRRWLPRPA